MPKRRGPRISAGLLMFRRREGQLELFLAHPGGPFFARKDDGHWTIPKVEPDEGEDDLLLTAKREFFEEVGIQPNEGPFIPLGNIQQKGGKIVHAWAFEGDLPQGHSHQCNTFETEWPIGSGRFAAFPEIDRVCFFSLEEARKKLKDTQQPFIDRLESALRTEAQP
jgi:predicted NUDIX family NTP pyrophosphohydrolase